MSPKKAPFQIRKGLPSIPTREMAGGKWMHRSSTFGGFFLVDPCGPHSTHSGGNPRGFDVYFRLFFTDWNPWDSSPLHSGKPT